MNRDQFINFLMDKPCPGKFTDEQLDGIEQFCFQLFDQVPISLQIAKLVPESDLHRFTTPDPKDRE